MLATDDKPTLALKGINQQDFKQIQLVVGSWPAQTGLQKRIPGKTLQRIVDRAVGSIYVFYMVYGRAFTLIDFGTLQIDEIVVPPITLPGLPPTGNIWFDTFTGYSPDGLISRLWGGGIWANAIGVCETLIEGIIDPFLVYDTIAPGRATPSITPIPLPPPGESPATTPADEGSSGYLYPPGTEPDILLHRTLALADNSCTGQGTQPVPAVDYINLRDYEESPILDTLAATSVTVGSKITWHGVTVGRDVDSDIGLVIGTCPGPPWPIPFVYFVLTDGTFGPET